jgi:hypothetical protein
MNANPLNSTPVEPLSRRIHRFISQARFATMSLLLHVILVLLTASVVLVHTTEPPEDFVAAGDLLSDSSDSAPRLQDPLVEPQVQVSPVDPVAAPIQVVSTTTASTFTTAITPSSPGAVVANLGSKIGEGMKGGAGLGGGVPGGTRMSFFGTKAQAASVVFAVDVSGSMISGPKSVKTYEVLEKEIIRAIRELDAQTRFSVVVFSKDAMSYDRGLVRATNEEKQRVFNWLRKVSPEQGRDAKATEEERQFHHGTRADRGLAEAFSMNPDVIFFVSDGEPTGKTSSQILEQVLATQRERAQPAVINVVAYLADSGQKFMRELAQHNRGVYREVNPRDLK